MSEPSEPLGRRMEAAIYEAAQGAGTMIVKYVLVAQTVMPDGKPDLWVCTSDEATPWDTLGLLSYATELEKADVGVEAEEGDE